jgi:hypothetical protein
MAVRANIIVDQNSTFNAQLQLNDPNGNPINVEEFQIKSQIRKNYTSVNSVPFVTTGNSSGVIVMSLGANTTQSLAVGRYVYDLTLTDGSGAVRRIMEGQVTITGGVSK